MSLKQKENTGKRKTVIREIRDASATLLNDKSVQLIYNTYEKACLNVS